MHKLSLLVLSTVISGCASVMDVSMYRIGSPDNDWDLSKKVVVAPDTNSDWNARHMLDTVVTSFMDNGIDAYSESELEILNYSADYLVIYDFSTKTKSYTYEYVDTDYDYKWVGDGEYSCKAGYFGDIKCTEGQTLESNKTETLRTATKSSSYRTMNIWVYDFLKDSAQEAKVYYSYAITSSEKCSDSYTAMVLIGEIVKNIKMGSEHRSENTIEVSGCPAS